MVLLKYTSAGRYSGEKQIAAAICIRNKISGPSPTGTKAHPRIIPQVVPTHGLSHPPTNQTQHHSRKISVGSFVLKLVWYVKKENNRAISHRHENTPTNYTTHVLPTHVHPHHPTDQATSAVQQCSSMYGGIPVREEHLGGFGVLRTRSTVRNAGRCVVLRPPAISWIASEPPPTNNPPPTHLPTNPPLQQYNSTGTVRTHQFTTVAQHYGSTHHSGTPVVRQELGGICAFLRFSTLRRRARAVPGRGVSCPPLAELGLVGRCVAGDTEG